MKKRRQASDKEKRKPKQARACDTVETIFAATAQLLQREGPGRLSTNRIAERAGVSIGSLYQYFPDMDAILVAMGRRQLATAQAAVAAAPAQAPSLVPEQRARLVIRSLIAHFGSRRKLRGHLLETLMALGLHEEINRPGDRAGDGAAGAPSRAAHRPVCGAGKAFVLTRAVAGVRRNRRCSAARCSRTSWSR